MKNCVFVSQTGRRHLTVKTNQINTYPKGNRTGWHERRLITKLTMDHSVKVRLDQGETRSMKHTRGVREGCCLLPILFYLYSKYVTKKALKVFGHFKIEGQVIFYPCRNSHCGQRRPHYRGLTITHKHTTTSGNPLDERSARLRGL